jgi:hypothetical protein
VADRDRSRKVIWRDAGATADEAGVKRKTYQGTLDFFYELATASNAPGSPELIRFTNPRIEAVTCRG